MPPPPLPRDVTRGVANRSSSSTQNVNNANQLRGDRQRSGGLHQPLPSNVISASEHLLNTFAPASLLASSDAKAEALTLTQLPSSPQRLLPSSHCQHQQRASSSMGARPHSHAGSVIGGNSSNARTASTAAARVDGRLPLRSASATAATANQPLPSTSITSVLTPAEVERLRAANSRHQHRGVVDVTSSGGGMTMAQLRREEAGDREILDLHRMVLKRTEGGAGGSVFVVGDERGRSQRTSSVPRRSFSKLDDAPASLDDVSPPPPPISKVKGVAEALEVARLVTRESRVERSSIGVLVGGHSISQESQRVVDHGDDDADGANAHANGNDTVALNAISAIHGPTSALSTSVITTASHQTPSAQLNYLDRVVANAPLVDKLGQIMSMEMLHNSDKYTSGSALVDECREELDRFLTLEAKSISNTTPIPAEVRLATLFPHQSRQWKEVLEQTRIDGHLKGVALESEADGNGNTSEKGGPIDKDRALSPSARRTVEAAEAEAIGKGAMERHMARKGIDAAFKALPAHRISHLQKDVFKLSEAELDAFGDTTQLLHSKGEVQRLLQGMKASARQATLEEMRMWSGAVVRSNQVGHAFEEQLEKQRVGPDGCINITQLNQCLAAAEVTPSEGEMERFMKRVDPLNTNRLKVSLIREAWSEGELRLGLEPIAQHEARACLDLVIPAARQALGINLCGAHMVQWMGRLGTTLDVEDADAFVAKHHPLTCDALLKEPVFSEVQSLWLKAKSRSNDSVSEVGLHQRLRELETGQTKWDVALDDLERHADSMQNGFTALHSLQSEIDRQAKKVRLLAKLVPTKYSRNVAINTDVTYPVKKKKGSTAPPGGDGGDSDAEDTYQNSGGGRMPAWGKNRRRSSIGSATTAPGGGDDADAALGGGGDALVNSMSVGANAVIARDRLVDDLTQQVKAKNEELVRVRVLYEGYRFKAESSLRSATLTLQGKEAELAQMSERLQSYEMFEEASEAAGGVTSPEERLQEVQAHFLKKMKEAEASHQEEIRSFAKEIQTARNTFEQQRFTLMSELNEVKDANLKQLEKIRAMEAEVNRRDEALHANENASSGLAMNIKLLQMEVDSARAECLTYREKAKMFEEQLTMARKTQQLYVPREEMERRLREQEAQFQLKMGNALQSTETLEEELKVAKDKLHTATMNAIEVKANTEKRLNVLRIDVEKMATHRGQLLDLIGSTMRLWFNSMVGMRRGLVEDVEKASDLFPWMSFQASTMLQTLTEAAQTASTFVAEIAQGADTHNDLLEVLREARKENGRVFSPPRDDVSSEKSVMEARLTKAVNDAKEAMAATREVSLMLAIYKCAVSNFEDTLTAVTEAVGSAAKGDDRSINRYNLTGPGAEHIDAERMAEAMRAFVPRRMPTSPANALELVGGEDGLKNKEIENPNKKRVQQDPSSEGGNASPSSSPSNKPATFAARMAMRKNGTAGGAVSDKKSGGKEKESSAAATGAFATPEPIVEENIPATLLTYDPPTALQTLSQSLHSTQTRVFSVLGTLSSRFTVLNGAVEQAAAHSSAAMAATAEAKQALKKQLNKGLYLDEEDELDALIRERRTKRGQNSQSAEANVDESLAASQAAPIVEGLLWASRAAVNLLATNAVKPLLLKAEQLSTSIDDKTSIRQVADTHQRLYKARAPYVKLLMYYLFILRGANRRVKRTTKAFTDAMFAQKGPQEAGAAADASSNSKPSKHPPSAPSNKKTTVVNAEALRASVVSAKDALNAIVMKAAVELPPLIDRYQQALWQAHNVAEHVIHKAQAAVETATATAAEEAMKSASVNQTTIAVPKDGVNKGAGAGRLGVPNTGNNKSSRNATPSLQHLGAGGGGAVSKTPSSLRASPNKSNLKSAVAQGKKATAATKENVPDKVASVGGVGGAAVGGGDSALVTPIIDAIGITLDGGDAVNLSLLDDDGTHSQKGGNSKEDEDPTLNRHRSFDEAFRAFDLDGGHTFISESDNSSSSSRSSSASSSFYSSASASFASLNHKQGLGGEGSVASQRKEGQLGARQKRTEQKEQKRRDNNKNERRRVSLSMTGTVSVGTIRKAAYPTHQDGAAREVREVGTQANSVPRQGGGGGGGGGHPQQPAKTPSAAAAAAGKNNSAVPLSAGKQRANEGVKKAASSTVAAGQLQPTVSMGAHSARSGRSTKRGGGKEASSLSNAAMDGAARRQNNSPQRSQQGEGVGGSGPHSPTTTPRLQPTLSTGAASTSSKQRQSGASSAALVSSSSRMKGGGGGGGEGSAARRRESSRSTHNGSQTNSASSPLAASASPHQQAAAAAAASEDDRDNALGRGKSERSRRDKKRAAGSEKESSTHRHNTALRAKLESYEAIIKELRFANKQLTAATQQQQHEQGGAVATGEGASRRRPSAGENGNQSFPALFKPTPAAASSSHAHEDDDEGRGGGGAGDGDESFVSLEHARVATAAGSGGNTEEEHRGGRIGPQGGSKQQGASSSSSPAVSHPSLVHAVASPAAASVLCGPTSPLSSQLLSGNTSSPPTTASATASKNNNTISSTAVGANAGKSPSNTNASKAEAAKARREEAERVERERREQKAAAQEEKAHRTTAASSSSSPAAKAKAAAAQQQQQQQEAFPAAANRTVQQSETNLTDVRVKENRVSSAARSRPLPRPMSGNNGGGGTRTQRPLHREESDSDLMAKVRPSSASLRGGGAEEDATMEGGMRNVPFPTQLQFVPHYLRPSMATSSTQTDLGDLIRAGVAVGPTDIDAPLYPPIPLERRVRAWEDIQKDFAAQEEEAMRRLGRVLYAHVSGVGSNANNMSSAAGPPAYSSSSLKAQPTTAKVPSYHLTPPTGKAFCGLKYKEILVEDEAFEAKNTAQSAALDVIFSSLPPECRVVAAKYCMLVMFGGPSCPLASSYDAFEKHLLSYHFSPHSHIRPPRSTVAAEKDVLRWIHSDLLRIGHVLLTGEYSKYNGGGNAHRRSLSPPPPISQSVVVANTSNSNSSSGSGASAVPPSSSLPQQHKAIGIGALLKSTITVSTSTTKPAGNAEGGEGTAATDPSVERTATTAVVAGASGQPHSVDHYNDGAGPCWVNIENYGGAVNGGGAVVKAAEGGEELRRMRAGSSTTNGFDEAVKAMLSHEVTSTQQHQQQHSLLSPIHKGGEVLEGKRFLLAGQPLQVSFSVDNSTALRGALNQRPNTPCSSPAAAFDMSSVVATAAVTPFRVKPLPTPSTIPSAPFSSAEGVVQLEVVPAKSSATDAAISSTSVGNAQNANGGRLPPANRSQSGGGGGGRPSRSQQAILAAHRLTNPPSMVKGDAVALVEDPTSPFVDRKRILIGSRDGRRSSSSSMVPEMKPFSTSAVGMAMRAEHTHQHQLALRAIASAQPNEGTRAMEKAINDTMRANTASAANAPSPLMVARVLRDGSKGTDSFDQYVSTTTPVVAAVVNSSSTQHTTGALAPLVAPPRNALSHPTNRVNK